MSKVALQGNVSGTGTFTLAAPNSSTDRTLDLPDASGVIDRLNRAGNVLQVVQTVKTDTFSSSSTSFTDVTGLSVSITPLSATSKILILACVSGTGQAFTTQLQARLLRDSTAIFVGDAASSRTQATFNLYMPTGDGSGNATPIFLDSPSTTSAVTYKVQMRVWAGNGYINRTTDDTDNSNITRTTSSITVMEIAG